MYSVSTLNADRPQATMLQAEGMDVHESNEGCGGLSIKAYEKGEIKYFKDLEVALPTPPRP